MITRYDIMIPDLQYQLMRMSLLTALSSLRIVALHAVTIAAHTVRLRVLTQIRRLTLTTQRYLQDYKGKAANMRDVDGNKWECRWEQVGM